MTEGQIHVFVARRRHGKTTKCLQWLKQARRVDAYPFWDRVLLVPDIRQAQHLRIQLRQEAEALDEIDSGLYYNLVYSIREWENAHISMGWRGQVAIDDAEWILQQLVQGRVSFITMTGQLLHDRDPRTI